MNKVIIIGNLGRDPEMRYMPSGQAVTSFSMASTRKYTTSDGERKEETTWFNVSFFGKLAEVANQYLVKGGQAYVEGSVKVREYEGRDGDKRFSLDVSGSALQLLGGGERSEQREEVAVGGSQDIDDLPF